MNKNLIPTYYLNNIFEIDFNKIRQLEIDYLFIDLDNTLANPYISIADDNVINLINHLNNLSFKIIVLSNNHEDRVKTFCKDLNVSYLYEVKKPNKKRLNSYLIDNNIDITKSILIGDQVMTDILLANRLKIKSILLNPLTNQDEPITFIPRLLDKHFKKRIIRKHLDRKL